MTDIKMIEKTDERIAAEKDAVQKMIGARTAMSLVLDRITRLEAAIKGMHKLSLELYRLTPPEASIKTSINPSGIYSDLRMATAKEISGNIAHIARMNAGD